MKLPLTEEDDFVEHVALQIPIFKDLCVKCIYIGSQTALTHGRLVLKHRTPQSRQVTFCLNLNTHPKAEYYFVKCISELKQDFVFVI